MPDLPKLPPDAWARIGLLEMDAAERLRKDIAFVRSSFRDGEDEAAYFHWPLCFYYADYIADLFFAPLDEYAKSFGLGRVMEELNRLSVELSSQPILYGWSRAGSRNLRMILSKLRTR